MFDMFTGGAKRAVPPTASPIAGTSGVSAMLGGREAQEDAYCVRQAGSYLYAGAYNASYYFCLLFL